MCEAKWPSVVAYVSMDHIFVQTVYRTGTDEIGALKKKCTCVPLCSAVVSSISQGRKLNPGFSSQFTCLKKPIIWWVCGNLHPTTQGWNYIPDFVTHFYRIHVSNTLSQTNSTGVKSDYKIKMFVCRRAGLEVTLKYSSHLPCLLLSNGLFANRRFCFTNLIHDSLLQ